MDSGLGCLYPSRTKHALNPGHIHTRARRRQWHLEMAARGGVDVTHGAFQAIRRALRVPLGRITAEEAEAEEGKRKGGKQGKEGAGGPGSLSAAAVSPRDGEAGAPPQPQQERSEQEHEHEQPPPQPSEEEGGGKQEPPAAAPAVAPAAPAAAPPAAATGVATEEETSTAAAAVAAEEEKPQASARDGKAGAVGKSIGDERVAWGGLSRLGLRGRVAPGEPFCCLDPYRLPTFRSLEAGDADGQQQEVEQEQQQAGAAEGGLGPDAGARVGARAAAAAAEEEDEQAQRVSPIDGSAARALLIFDGHKQVAALGGNFQRNFVTSAEWARVCRRRAVLPIYLLAGCARVCLPSVRRARSSHFLTY